MPKLSPATELSNTINKLRAQRAELVAQVTAIDNLFSGLGISSSHAASGAALAVKIPGKRGRKPGSTNAPKPAASGRRRKRGSFSISGEESVLGFVKSFGKPNALEVNTHWQKEGRGGKADNTLSKLVKDGRLKRLEAKDGERGGRYAAA